MHWVSLSIAQVLIVPWHPPVVHEQPMTAAQAVVVAFEEQGVTVPVQALVLQVQPYSPEHAVEVVFAAQGVTVPVQYCELQVQPREAVLHAVDVVSEPQFGVPVQVEVATCQVQPGVARQYDDE